MLIDEWQIVTASLGLISPLLSSSFIITSLDLTADTLSQMSAHKTTDTIIPLFDYASYGTFGDTHEVAPEEIIREVTTVLLRVFGAGESVHVRIPQVLRR